MIAVCCYYRAFVTVAGTRSRNVSAVGVVGGVATRP